MNNTVTVSADTLHTLVGIAIEMWQMSTSEWSHYPDKEDCDLLDFVAKLDGDPEFILLAGNLRREAESVVAHDRQKLLDAKADYEAKARDADEALRALDGEKS